MQHVGSLLPRVGSSLWHAGSLVGAMHVGSSSLTRIEPGPPALGARTLRHWTTREVPCCLFDDGHPDGCEVLSHCGFDLRFLDH